MNIYLLSQSEKHGYDTYNCCVVAAESEEEARKIHPDSDAAPIICKDGNFAYEDGSRFGCHSWASCVQNVQCKLLGTGVAGLVKGVVNANFRSG